MARKINAFTQHVLDLMKGVPGVSVKRMFGGEGLFRHGFMFGILADDELYFKTTDKTRTIFENRNLKPFTYTRKGKKVALSYYQAPPECLDEASLMMHWVDAILSNQIP